MLQFLFLYFMLLSNHLPRFYITRKQTLNDLPLGTTPNNYSSISSLPSQDANQKKSLHKGILNKDQDDEMFVYGYKKSSFRTFFCYVCFGLTLGILRLVMHWWSHWLLYATHKECKLEDAEKVLVKEEFQGKHSIFYVKVVTTLTSDSIR